MRSNGITCLAMAAAASTASWAGAGSLPSSLALGMAAVSPHAMLQMFLTSLHIHSESE